MLGTATLRALEDFARRSHEAYPEGGLIYTFTEAASQAHSLLLGEFSTRGAAKLPDDELAQLALVIGRSLGGFDLTSADGHSLTIAGELMDQLQADLEFDVVGAIADDYDVYCWGCTIHMARTSNNRYFSLMLWGSHD
jgi:hypothetical protein